MVWMISANKKTYDYASAFATYNTIEWTQSAKIDIGDTVYIYCSKPEQKLMYKCAVLNCDLSFNDRLIDDSVFWKDQTKYEEAKEKKFMRLKLIKHVDTEMLNIEHLQKNGLKYVVLGPRTVSSDLVDYIETYF